MKVTMSQSTLLESLKRGALAALSDEAQTDTSTLSMLIKSVKIGVEMEEITFESATALIASKYVLPVTDKISIKETGKIMIPAKELFDWVNRQGECMIGLRFKALDVPSTIGAVGEADVKTKAAISKTGSVEMVSMDSSKTGSKWSLDSYDYQQIPWINYDFSSDPLFILPLEQLTESIKGIGFTVLPSCEDHVFDSFSFQHKNKEMYMVTCDLARCAIWNIPNADKINMAEAITSEQIEKKGMKGAWESNLLVPSKFLTEICKLSSGNVPISFHRDAKANKIYVSQPGFEVRMATADQSKVEKFPPLDLFLTKKYHDLCKVPKDILLNRLNTVSMVNKNAILFSFGNEQLMLQAISESGHAPCKANLKVNELDGTLKRVWNVKHFIDVLKAISDEMVQILVPDDNDKDSIKFISTSKPNGTYFAMAIEKSKYDISED